MFDKNKFKVAVLLSGYSVKEIAEFLGINPSTFYRKINNDGNFSRREIGILKDKLKIKNINEIFFTH